MTTTKVKVGYMLAGVLLTALILYPKLKETRREQPWGLLMNPEEVKGACGKPQVDNIYDLTYISPDSRIELRFMGMNHQMYLNHVRWNSSKGGVGDINKVTKDLVSDWVKRGYLPQCLDELAR